MKNIDRILTHMASKMNWLPTPVKMVIAVPLAIGASLVILPVMGTMIIVSIVKSPFEKQLSLPTPRDIYKRTGIKVNGYNGYSE